METNVFVFDRIDYVTAWHLQKELFTEVKMRKLPSALILCSHPPVITLGRRALSLNIKATENELKEKGVPVYRVERAGEVTYHGPGQVTAYPIINLEYLKKDIHWFLRKLESIAISLCSDFKLEAARKPGLTGVWVDRAKIASIGIAIKSWITFHGMSLNITRDDLHNFRLIRPCGMEIPVTSLETELGTQLDTREIKERLLVIFSEVFPSVFLKQATELSGVTEGG